MKPEYGSVPRQERFMSPSLKRELDYLVCGPDSAPPRAIVIYMHGAGGKVEQGMSVDNYGGAFGRLRQLAKQRRYLYVCAEADGFRAEAGRNLIELTSLLAGSYPGIPVYIAGASAGGRAVVHSIVEGARGYAGIVLICPGVDRDVYADRNMSLRVPVYVSHGIQDGVVPVANVDQYVEYLKRQGVSVTYDRITGDHDAPLIRMDWHKALETVGCRS